MPAPLPILINTRPIHRGDAIRQMTGVMVVDLPLLEIRSLSISECEQAMMMQFCQGAYDALVITSVESARRALDYLRSHQVNVPTLPNTPIIAVGTATAQVMQAYGFDVILPQTANNEGMLTLPQIKSLTAHDRVLIWRGVGGRRLLHDTLTAKGVHIDAIEWYERTTPSDLYDNFSAILPTLPTTPNHAHVIISSEMAYQAWASLPHAETRYHYLALGERLARIIRTHEPSAAISMIDDLSVQAIGRAISIAQMQTQIIKPHSPIH
jgi:uroporphyrinogen-III synthase